MKVIASASTLVNNIRLKKSGVYILTTSAFNAVQLPAIRKRAFTQIHGSAPSMCGKIGLVSIATDDAPTEQETAFFGLLRPVASRLRGKDLDAQGLDTYDGATQEAIDFIVENGEAYHDDQGVVAYLLDDGSEYAVTIEGDKSAVYCLPQDDERRRRMIDILAYLAQEYVSAFKIEE